MNIPIKYNLLAFALLIIWGLLLLTGCQARTPQPTLTPNPPPATVPSTNTPESPPPTATVQALLPPPTPIGLLLQPTTTEVEVEYLAYKTEDNVKIAGKLYGKGDIAVILAHQGTSGANQRDWNEFARLMAGRGFAVMTFDFRGRGASEAAAPVTNLLIWDMLATIGQLRERGYQRIACIGASMGGSACLRAAIETDLIGVGIVASTMSTGKPTSTSPEELAQLTIPKLFLCAENDRYEGLTEGMREMYQIAPEPKRLQFFPGTAHGTEMFDQPFADEFTAEMVYFLESLR